MVLDNLENAKLYSALHQGFEEAFQFLKTQPLEALKPGNYEIKSDKIFAIVSEGTGVAKAEAKLEVHRKYIDIQYIIKGTDHMGWKPLEQCQQVETSYNKEKDFAFYTDEAATWFDVPAGCFVIFFPEDAHAPLATTAIVKKVVIKIAVTL